MHTFYIPVIKMIMFASWKLELLSSSLSLRVKPEGIPVEKVQSEFKCLPANSTGDTKVESGQLNIYCKFFVC